MLERASRCVENAREHVIQRCSARLRRSRQMLHTNFWRHGTLDIDLPLWCLSLMQQPHQSMLEVRRLACDSSSLLQNFTSHQFLDFLYPPRTRSFARSLARNQRRRNNPAFRGRKGTSSRGYASSADENFGENLEQGPQKISNNVSGPPSSSSPKARSYELPWVEHLLNLEERAEHSRSLREILVEQRPNDYRTAWKLYKQEENPEQYAVEVFRYLSRSESHIDAERACMTFDSVPCHHRKARDYYHAIRLAFSTKASHRRVMNICEEALLRLRGELCWNLAFKLSILHAEWGLALDLWNKLFFFDKKRVLRPSIPIQDLSFVEFPDRLLSLLEAIGSKKLPLSSNTGLVELVHFLVRHVLSSDKVVNSPLSRVLQIFRQLSAQQLIDSRHYLWAFQRLLNTGTRAAFVRSIVLYRNFRWMMPDEVPPQWLLKRYMAAACKYRMSESMGYLLKQFRLLYEKPDEGTYLAALTTYARMGDVSQVRQTFNDLVDDHGTPSNDHLISPLLYVHARLGDIAQTKSKFEVLKETYPDVSRNVVFWNILLTAYSNAGDLDGAISTFGEMGRAGVSLDSHSHGVMMGLLAKRGDVDAVRKLADAAKRSGIPITGPMVDTVVQALCRNGGFEEAEQVVRESRAMDPPVDVTRSFNILLLNYAFRADVDSVSRVQREMHLSGITFTDMTYAALMLSLVFVRDTESARKILGKLHRTKYIHVNEFHYSIILHGYFREHNMDMVHIIYKEMTERFGKAGSSADLTMLWTLIQRDLQRHKEKSRSERNNDPVKFNHSERFLESVMKRFGVSDYGAPYPQPGAKRRKLRDAFPSSYYESLIDAYSSQGEFSKAELLHENYKKKVEPFSNTDQLPLQHLHVLMRHHFECGRHDQVESCWETALQRVRQAAKPVDIDPLLEAIGQSPSSQSSKEQLRCDKQNSVLRCNRFSLEWFINLYTKSLSARNLWSKIDSMINDIQQMGFELTSNNWSVYIRLLCKSSRPADQLRAFVLFEEKYVDYFPGWAMMRERLSKRPPGAHAGLDILDEQPSRDEGMMGRLASRVWADIEPDYMNPTYLTVLHLVSAFIDFSNRAIEHGNEEMNTLSSQAPKTIRALSTIPYLQYQFDRYVIRHRSLPDRKPREIIKPHHTVSTGGLLGVDDQPRLDTRPPEQVWQEIERRGDDVDQDLESLPYVQQPIGDSGEPPETSEPDSETLQKLLAQNAEYEGSLRAPDDGMAHDVQQAEPTLPAEDELDIELESRLHETSREAESLASMENARASKDGNPPVRTGGFEQRAVHAVTSDPGPLDPVRDLVNESDAPESQFETEATNISASEPTAAGNETQGQEPDS